MHYGCGCPPSQPSESREEYWVQWSREFMSAENKLTSKQHSQIKIDIAKFPATPFFKNARNLSLVILS